VYVALVPPKETPVAPVRPLPLIVTAVPVGPLVGANPVIAGGGGGGGLEAVTVKPALLLEPPLELVTLIGPVVAPAGTVALIELSDCTENDAAVPLKATPVTACSPCPLIVTAVPTGPLAGVNPEIDGPFAAARACAAEAEDAETTTTIATAARGNARSRRPGERLRGRLLDSRRARPCTAADWRLGVCGRRGTRGPL
jgi:hypothetical protein